MTRFALLLILAGLLFALPKWYLAWRYEATINNVDQAPTSPIAIVFGAGLRRDGRPSAVLVDRIVTAVDLFHQGKVEQILMSGSSDGGSYNEPSAMRQFAISMGVPEENILVDDQGTRTLQTCLQARNQFGIQQALLVSQRYHLPRALETCRSLGIEASGVSADVRRYHPRALRFWELREMFATVVAILELRFGMPAISVDLPSNTALRLMEADLATQ